MSAENNGSFWTSLPGILTGLATLLTAFAGFHKIMHDMSSSSAGDPIAEKTCNIKGNISQASKAKLYHIPTDKDYGRTVIDSSKGEKMFCSEAEAVQNGWQRASH